MKKFIGLLLLVAVAFVMMPPQITADDNPIKTEQVEKVTMEKSQAEYQAMVDALDYGDPITFHIPPIIKDKLSAVCCYCPGDPCIAYCCWRCSDPGKGCR